MGIGTSIAIFLTVWWTVLFAVLPLGTRTHAEMGIEVPGGGDPAAPVNPNLKHKFFTTTWVAMIVFAAIWLIIRFGLIDLPSLPSGY
jgi:predicted secreted protein